MIVLVGGEKGGSGKTTIATNLAAMRQAVTKDLLLVDTDMQRTASFWCSSRHNDLKLQRITSVSKYDKEIRHDVLSLQNKYQDIIIDAGGRDSVELRGALTIADKAIFPIRPSQFDLWTLGRLSTLIDEMLPINPKLQGFVVLNQASTNPAVKEVPEAQNLVNEFPNLRLMDVVICERIAFRRAAIEGKCVVEYKPLDAKAVEEIEKLYSLVFGI